MNEEAKQAGSCHGTIHVLKVNGAIIPFDVWLDTKGVNGRMEHQPLHVRHPASGRRHTLNVTQLKSISCSCAAWSDDTKAAEGRIQNLERHSHWIEAKSNARLVVVAPCTYLGGWHRIERCVLDPGNTSIGVVVNAMLVVGKETVHHHNIFRSLKPQPGKTIVVDFAVKEVSMGRRATACVMGSNRIEMQSKCTVSMALVNTRDQSSTLQYLLAT